MNHTLSKIAALLIAAALGVLAGGLTDALLTKPAGAAEGLPKVVGRYQVVWVVPSLSNGTMKCYVARPWTTGKPGVWLCG